MESRWIENYISLCVQSRGAKIRLYVLCELASRDCQQTGQNAVKSASIPEIHTLTQQSKAMQGEPFDEPFTNEAIPIVFGRDFEKIIFYSLTFKPG